MKSSKTDKKWAQVRLAYAFLAPTILILGLFHFYPMSRAFYLSFWQYFPNSPNNEFIGLANFARLTTDPDFHSALFNSFLYLLAVPVIISLSLALAMLVEPKLPGMDFFRAAYYLPVVTMMVVVAYAWRLIFNTDNGFLNEFLIQYKLIEEGIPWLTSSAIALWTIMSVTIWKGLGYYMVMFIVGLRSVPVQLKEAAKIDGANPVQVFKNVTLPMLWPTITIVSVISAISALKVFEEIYMMTRGKIDTATLVYQIYETGFDLQTGSGLEMGYACAMGVVLFGIVFVLSAASIKMMESRYATV